MLDRSLCEQLSDLDRGEYSCAELTRAYLDRIAADSLNCFISVSETAADQAFDADKQRRRGSQKPLLGIPVAHKDIFCEKGVKTSAGSRMLDNFIAPYDATVVARLRDAGVVSLGKTNMDEFAMGSSSESSYYGCVKNPWNESCVPGGSSGGSAAAVAAQLCAAATGTDTGGSIRQPAAFCGVTGIKPTWGRVSRWGMIAYASSLDQAGPIARTAEDCALLLTAMAGPDERDATSASAPVQDYRAHLDGDLRGVTLGLCRAFMDDLEPAVSGILDRVTSDLASLGANFAEIDLPASHLAIPAYYIIAPAECSANLSRYDGVRFGYRCQDPQDLNDLYKRSRSEGFGPEVKRRILAGAFALSAGYYDAYYRKAQQIRRLIKNDFLAAFEKVDAILGPTTPGPAFLIGEKSGDRPAMYLQDTYTTPANLAGLPALSFPAGFAGGLPVGAQLTGRHFDEAGLLRICHRYQAVTDWHRRRPGEAA